jgi:hypothetical protein
MEHTGHIYTAESDTFYNKACCVSPLLDFDDKNDLDMLLPIERQQLLDDESSQQNSSWRSFTPTPRTLRVHFAELDELSYVTPCSSMSLEEKRELWYQRSDLDRFKRNAQEQHNEKRKKRDCYSTRGLDLRGGQRNHTNAVFQAYFPDLMQQESR